MIAFFRTGAGPFRVIDHGLQSVRVTDERQSGERFLGQRRIFTQQDFQGLAAAFDFRAPKTRMASLFLSPGLLPVRLGV